MYKQWYICPELGSILLGIPTHLIAIEKMPYPAGMEAGRQLNNKIITFSVTYYGAEKI
jgi:hypothetical protein